MKIEKLDGYRPGYPSKKPGRAVKAGAVAAAAVLAVGTSLACKPVINGDMRVDETAIPSEVCGQETDPEATPFDELMIEGELAADPGELIGDDGEPGPVGIIMPDPSAMDQGGEDGSR